MKKTLFFILSATCVISAVILASLALKMQNMSFLSVVAVSLLCIPFFLSYERNDKNNRITVIIAVMTALAVIGRFVFAETPGFKPVTAVVIITGIYLGPQAGFMTGALSALISNIYFGQGPFTPFQMFAWGITGFLAAILNKNGLLEKKVPLIIYGALAGVLFSLIMDVYTVLIMTGGFSFLKYITAITSSAWFTGIYTFSNIVFLLLMMIPADRIMKRIKIKYDV